MYKRRTSVRLMPNDIPWFYSLISSVYLSDLGSFRLERNLVINTKITTKRRSTADSAITKKKLDGIPICWNVEDR